MAIIKHVVCMFALLAAFGIVHGGPDNYRPFQCTTKKFTHKTLTNPKLIWSIQNATEDECAVACWHLKQAGRDCHSFNYFPTASPKRCDLLEDNLQGKNPNKILTPSKGAAHVIVQRCTKTSHKPTTTVAPISTSDGPIECTVTEYPLGKMLRLARAITREDGKDLDKYTTTKEDCVESCVRYKLSGTNCNSVNFYNKQRCVFLEDIFENGGANDSYPFLDDFTNAQHMTVKCPVGAPATQIPPTPGSCGRSFAPSQIPYAGESVRPRNAAPWTVSLWKLDGNGGVCKATLIRLNDRIEESDTAVVSASCLKDFNGKVPSNAYATAGTRQNAETVVHDKVPVVAIVLHPGFSKSDMNKYNDVAVVKFGRAFQFSEEIQPACLPKAEEQMGVGSRGVAYWWSILIPIDKRSIDHLTQTSGDLISNDECIKAHKASGLTIQSKSQFCARVITQYSANGSPYFLPDQRGHTLEGLHSSPDIWQETSNDYKSLPYVYTRVAKYVDWIREQAQKLTAVRG